MERNTRESVEPEYKYLVFDIMIDMALSGEITLDEAIAKYREDVGIE